jgi:hypothetical protein
MTSARPALAFLAALCAIPGMAACGDDGGDEPAREAQPPRERADREPALPGGWRRVVNQGAGFSLGIPPGWTARGAQGATVVRSRDGGLAISVVADRGQDARGTSAADYLQRTLMRLPGYSGLRVNSARPLRQARYPGAVASGTGTFTRTRVRQAISGYALQRPGQVTYTLLVFRSARAPANRYGGLLDQMLRSFTARPATSAGAPGG